jgi:hypothetical protein
MNDERKTLCGSAVHRSSFRVPRFLRPRRGVGMVELLIALSITAALLTATAVAVDAAFKGYKINEENTLLTQRARVALNFMTTSIRTTQLHAPDTAGLATQFAGGATVTDTGIDMYDAGNRPLTFRYDAANKRLLAVSNGTTYVMAQGVESFQVKMEPMRSSASVKTGGGWDLLRRATITLSVRTNAATALPSETTGRQVVTLSASVMPRRNAW